MLDLRLRGDWRHRSRDLGRSLLDLDCQAAGGLAPDCRAPIEGNNDPEGIFALPRPRWRVKPHLGIERLARPYSEAGRSRIPGGVEALEGDGVVGCFGAAVADPEAEALFSLRLSPPEDSLWR